MFLELINELFSDFSPVYIYLGFLASIVCLELFQVHFDEKLTKNELRIRRIHDMQFSLIPAYEVPPRLRDFRSWFSTIVKRIAAPDDDTDAPSFSRILLNKFRGGKIWNEHHYSLSLKEQVLSPSFYY
ncbi:hypothetical protein D8M04_12325 [Oceanobacillus piezotolerans]|uniref:Uncharacterized protein n=2 Tax=Oceanobacillus piezotolerans TaxID=2448030 RepID=A0A498D519_9BACI|nr:hypothetical protein D8M04_12325 [Oceanobacillus piezotolerans]